MSHFDNELFAIQPAADADIEAILECLGIAFDPYRSAYTEGAFLDTTLDRRTLCERMTTMKVFVAKPGSGEISEVVGTIACQCGRDCEGHIRGMAVRPEYQSKGVALELLSCAEADLRKAGCRRVTLDTTIPLKRAQRFYEKHGYKPTGVTRDFYGMDLIELAKDLP